MESIILLILIDMDIIVLLIDSLSLVDLQDPEMFAVLQIKIFYLFEELISM